MYSARKSYFGFGANSCIKPVKGKEEAPPPPEGCPCGVLIVVRVTPSKRDDPSRN